MPVFGLKRPDNTLFRSTSASAVRPRHQRNRSTLPIRTERGWKKVKKGFHETVAEVKSSQPQKYTSSSHLRKNEVVIAGYVFSKITLYLVIGYITIFVIFALYLIISGASKEDTRPDAEKMIVNNINGVDVVPGNPITKGGWNDTPTVGMTGEYRGNRDKSPQQMATKRNTSVSDTTPVPAGMPVTSPKFCTTPTGFLMRAVQAYNQGMKTGIVTMDGVGVDMGSDGAFWDRWGDGCCDSYCRVVTNGNYWSCIDPRTRTTQYEQSLPRGRKCTQYGNDKNILE